MAKAAHRRRQGDPQKVIPGRFTAQVDESFVVFMVGMRINRLLALRKWLPTVRALIPMLYTLRKHPSIGYLGGYHFWYWRGIAMVQYWRSFDDLEAFARDKNDPHFPAWRRFNQTIGADGSVGIWHETFVVEAGSYEGLYNNMPVFGLAAATEHVSAVGGRETARRRLGGENEPALASPVPSTP